MYWVENPDSLPLAIIPRPRASDWLEDDLRALQSAGVHHLISLLSAFERWQLDLDDEPAACQRVGLDFRAFPLPDCEAPPSALAVKALIDDVVLPALRRGEGVGFHGRAGVGRAPLMVASVLVCCGVGPEDAWRLVRATRNVEMPDNDAQYDWLFRFSEARAAGI